MISYGKQTIDQSDIDAVIEVLKGDWLTQGPAVVHFEDDLRKYFKSNFACAVSNGTAALHLGALALGWKPGDIVITTPITFLATANCITYVGAIPDFVDIDPVSYTIDPIKLEEKILTHRSNGKTVKAVIGVDFAGHPCDWEALRNVANKYSIQLVNDNCHAIGASYLNNYQYAIKYADIITQSFHPVKHFTTGEGGVILTNNEEIDHKVRTLRSHGMKKKTKLSDNFYGPWYYEMHEAGFNYRITDIQCALGSSQLKRLGLFLKRRREIAKKYDKSLSKVPGLQVPIISNNVEHAYHLYPLQINFDKFNISKVDFFKKMNKAGINPQVHYIPIHLQPFYKKMYGFSHGDYLLAEKFYEKEVSLPIYPNLKNEEQRLVIDTIIKIIEDL